MSDDAKKVRWTRRSALGLMAAGGGLVGLNTFGFTQSEGFRGTVLNLSDDEDALLGLLVGQSSLSILNNFEDDIEVEVEIPGDVTIVGEGENLKFPVTLDGVETENDDKEIVSTLDLVFELDSTNDGPKERDFTVTATGFGGSISRTFDIEVVQPDEIEDDPDPDGEADPDPVTVLFDDENGVEKSTHTWPVLNVDDDGFEFDEVELDYSEVDPSDSFENASERNASVTVIEGDTTAGLRINRGQSDVPANDGDKAILSIRGDGYEIDNGPVDIIVTVDDVKNPDDKSDEAEITFRNSEDKTFIGSFDSVELTMTAEMGSVATESEDGITLTATVEYTGGDALEQQDVRFRVREGEGTFEDNYGLTTTDDDGVATITYYPAEADAGETVTIEAVARGQSATTTFDVVGGGGGAGDDADDESDDS